MLALRSQPLEQHRRQVALRKRGNDHHNILAGVFLALADFDRRLERRTGGNTDRDAFEPGDEPCCFNGLAGIYGDDLVIDARVEDRRCESRADALDFVRTRGAAGEYREIPRARRRSPGAMAYAPSRPGLRR